MICFVTFSFSVGPRTPQGQRPHLNHYAVMSLSLPECGFSTITNHVLPVFYSKHPAGPTIAGVLTDVCLMNYILSFKAHSCGFS